MSSQKYLDLDGLDYYTTELMKKIDAKIPSDDHIDSLIDAKLNPLEEIADEILGGTE